MRISRWIEGPREARKEAYAVRKNKIMALRALGLTNKEIGERIGLGTERVRQIASCEKDKPHG